MTANRLNDGDRMFIEAFSADPVHTPNPDPFGGPKVSIVMHEVEEGPFLVQFVFEADFANASFRRVKRKRKL